MKKNILEVRHILFDSKKTRYILMAVSLIFLFSSAILHLLKPMYDPDFYGHLKTGFWIWEHRALPDFDPFTIEPQVETSHRTRFILTSAWLYQLLLCAFYKMGGFNGIIFFRYIIAAILVIIVVRFSVSKNYFTLLAAGIGTLPIIDAHFPERPQFISFVFTALILSVLLKKTRERDWSLWSLLLPLCLAMFLWSNMHGGFLMGLFILLFVLFAETVKFIHPGLAPMPRREYINLSISILSAVAVSFANPNHIYSMVMVLPSVEANDFIYSAIMELSSVYEILKTEGGYTPVIAFCTGIFAVILFICSCERTNITWIGLLVLLGYMGFSHIRYYPYFLICSTLFAIQYFDTKTGGMAAKTLLVSFFTAVVATSFVNIPRNLQSIATYGWVPTAYFPVKVCDFVNANGIGGNVFTSMNWGNYVLWKLGPQQKVFFDGRQIDPGRAWIYLFSMEHNWRSIYDKYDIRVLILPVYEVSGKLSQFTKVLETDPQWQLVNKQNNAALFLRKQPDKATP